MSRIYVVKPLNATNAKRLIEANSKSEVAQKILADFEIGPANTAEAIALAQSGVVLEQAGEATEAA